VAFYQLIALGAAILRKMLRKRADRST